MKQKAQIPVKGRKKFKLFYLCLLLLPLCYSCNNSDSSKEQFDPNSPVEVTAIIPETGAIALPLVIHGKNFGNDKSKIKVFFDDVQAQIITAKNEHLYVLNPKQTDGEHSVKVVVEDKEGVLKEKFTYIVTSSVSTVAGSGKYSDNDGNALEASFAGPEYISVDNKGNIFDSEYGGDYLRLISLSDNKVTTLIADGNTWGTCFSPDYSTLYVAIESSSILANELDCTSSFLKSVIPNTLDVEDGACTAVADSRGNVYYVGYYGKIIKKDITTEKMSVIGQIPDNLMLETYYGGVNYYAAYNPKDNHVYLSTKYDHVVFRFDAGKEQLEDYDFELYAGMQSQNGLNNGPRLQATFDNPRGMAFDSKGNMYVADSKNNVIRMIDPAGRVSTFIGKPEGGHKDGELEHALFNNPFDVAITPDDIIYIADYGNHRLRCIAIQ